MGRNSFSVIAAIIILTISASIHAQVRQTHLYIDDGFGKFLVLSAPLNGGSITFPPSGTLLTNSGSSALTLGVPGTSGTAGSLTIANGSNNHAGLSIFETDPAGVDTIAYILPTTGPSSGTNVLTTTSTSSPYTLTWAASGGGGLTLPYSNTVSNTATLFAVTNSNSSSGGAGSFTLSNNGNTSTALSATAGTSGVALSASGTTNINTSVNASTSINTGTSTGAVHIADGLTGGNTIAIGNTASTTGVTILAGSGNINIDTGSTAGTVHIADGAAANSVTIGSTTGTATTTLKGGSGGIVLGSNVSANGSMGTAGQVLTSQGSGSVPQWANPIYTYVGSTSNNINDGQFAAPMGYVAAAPGATQIQITRSGTLQNLFVAVPTTPASGKDYEIVIIKNGSATTFTADVTNGNTTANSASATLAVAAGDLIGIEMTHVTAAAANGKASWTFELRQ